MEEQEIKAVIAIMRRAPLQNMDEAYAVDRLIERVALELRKDDEADPELQSD